MKANVVDLDGRSDAELEEYKQGLVVRQADLRTEADRVQLLQGKRAVAARVAAIHARLAAELDGLGIDATVFAAAAGGSATAHASEEL